MMQYRVVFLSESGEPLGGELVYDVHGIELGATGIHAGGSDVYDTDVPAGTILYHASVPGYRPLTIETLFETTTFTLARETPVAKYVVLGGLAVGAVVLLSRFIKF
jgi:hypothetical protein